MSYLPPSGSAIAFAFGGDAYLPPAGNAVAFDFSASGGPGIPGVAGLCAIEFKPSVDAAGVLYSIVFGVDVTAKGGVAVSGPAVVPMAVLTLNSPYWWRTDLNTQGIVGRRLDAVVRIAPFSLLSVGAAGRRLNGVVRFSPVVHAAGKLVNPVLGTLNAAYNIKVSGNGGVNVRGGVTLESPVTVTVAGAGVVAKAGSVGFSFIPRVVSYGKRKRPSRPQVRYGAMSASVPLRCSATGSRGVTGTGGFIASCFVEGLGKVSQRITGQAHFQWGHRFAAFGAVPRGEFPPNQAFVLTRSDVAHVR